MSIRVRITTIGFATIAILGAVPSAAICQGGTVAFTPRDSAGVRLAVNAGTTDSASTRIVEELRIGVIDGDSMYQFQHAQERATVADQQQIEIAAANYILGTEKFALKDDERRAFAAFVLEPRLLVVPLLALPLDGSFRTIGDSKPAAETGGSHTPAHLATLLQILGLRAIVDDAKACPIVPTGSIVCRGDGYPGSYSFTAAWVEGNRAHVGVRIQVKTVRKGKGETYEPYFADASYFFLLERSRNGWTIVDLRHGYT